MRQAEATQAIVEGDALFADQPAGTRHVMVAEVFADAGQRVAHLDAEIAQAFGLADAGQFQQLRRIERAGADDDLTCRASLAHLAGAGVAHTGATLAVEHQPQGQGLGLDREVPALADRVQIAAGRAHAAAGGDRRLAHRDAFLAGAVVIRVVPDADLCRCVDERCEKQVARLRVGDAQRAFPAAEGILALAGIVFHALEERQDVRVAPAAVAHLRPGVEVLRLAAHKHHAVDRAGAAEQFAARHRDPAAVGACLGLGGIKPVGRGIGDQPGHSDRNARPGVARPTGLEQQHLVARVCRQPVRHRRTRRPGADDNVIVGLHVWCSRAGL
ncbi:MAG TPA: hypothetical protein VNV18_06760 [Stellaceae bacterium]|nr:hypothetical protein [Stellaceae bacterium]